MLAKKIEEEVRKWRHNGYHCPLHPLIGVLLRYQGSESDATALAYLRSAQFSALETYWYLRLVKKTSNILELYKQFYEGKELLDVLNIPYDQGELKWANSDKIIDRFIKNWETEKGSELYESITLPYSSYIFALAMGAGKTVLIGAIIATEFAMGLANPEGHFMRNALVFAPGRTIIESLRELSRVPYDRILPPAQYKPFMANLKMCYVSESTHIGVFSGSIYNLIVTNTEKIILRKRKTKGRDRNERKAVGNPRLMTIRSLPNLGVFSDEAHHTYGNKVGQELKRVRETINRLDHIVCVVNTTGTPYYKRKMLKDVVIWYGLSEGIAHNVLKSLHDGVREYEIGREKEPEIAARIILDFYKDYKDVVLPSGQKAKIAFYFKSQDDLDRTKNAIEHALAQLREPVTSILVNTQLSNKDELDEFNRLNDPRSQKRVILLVAKGREGWNCPSLFACALITQQTSSSNFVLQAAARCLRQVPGNNRAARVYLDAANKHILNKELQENFGDHTSLYNLSQQEQKQTVRVKILKTEPPKLKIEHIVKHLCKIPGTNKPLVFIVPKKDEIQTVKTHSISAGGRLGGTGSEDRRFVQHNSVHVVAMRLAAALHLSPLEVLKALQQTYRRGLVPEAHMDDLQAQAEQNLGTYEVQEERTMRVLALIHTHNPQGTCLFEEENGDLYHTLRFSKNNYERITKNGLLMGKKGIYGAQSEYSLCDDRHDISFHYSPYNFDSSDEPKFFLDILDQIGTYPSDLEGVFFMGGLT